MNDMTKAELIRRVQFLERECMTLRGVIRELKGQEPVRLWTRIKQALRAFVEA